jgi:hypothetical protein
MKSRGGAEEPRREEQKREEEKREEQKREDQRRESPRRKKIQVRERSWYTCGCAVHLAKG